MKRMWVYILECSDGTYYTGVTNNLERRLLEHKGGYHNGYTKERLPIRLMYSQEFDNPMSAIRREKQLKGWTHDKKKALIENDFEKLIMLSKSKRKNTSGRHGSTSSP